MLAPDTLLKGVNLKTITPDEALAFVQRLAAETLTQMSSDYYVRRLKAAAMRNQAGRHGWCS
jgi:hypothetical protein